jgi:hypothetical protein
MKEGCTIDNEPLGPGEAAIEVELHQVSLKAGKL